MRDAPSQDLTVIALLDRGLMAFYAQVRRNADRIARLTLALLPLMALLVGSCKTAEQAQIYSSNAGAAEFRTVLFPDQVNFHGADYYPAAGYVSRARAFVTGAPQTLALLTPQEIGYLFGKPTLHRQDADAEVWHYKTKSCVVDFYFYGQGGVSHVDVRPKGKTGTEPVSAREQSKCLHKVVAADFESTRA